MYEFDCDGNGVFEVGPQASNTHDCPFADNGTFTVNVRVTDGDGGADTGSDTVVVQNVAPHRHRSRQPDGERGHLAKRSTWAPSPIPGTTIPGRSRSTGATAPRTPSSTRALAGAIADKTHTYADDGSLHGHGDGRRGRGRRRQRLRHLPGDGRQRPAGSHRSRQPDGERGKLELVRARLLHRPRVTTIPGRSRSTGATARRTPSSTRAHQARSRTRRTPTPTTAPSRSP